MHVCRQLHQESQVILFTKSDLEGNVMFSVVLHDAETSVLNLTFPPTATTTKYGHPSDACNIDLNSKEDTNKERSHNQMDTTEPTGLVSKP